MKTGRFLTYFGLVLLMCQPKMGMALLIEQLPPQQIADTDLSARGNEQVINQHHITYTYQTILSHGKAYQLGKFSTPTTPANMIKFLVLHDSEDAAFDSGLQFIAEHGGDLWVLENQEHRNLYDVASQSVTNTDPNRIFWRLQPRDFPPQMAISPSDENPIKINEYQEFANYLLEQLGLNQQKLPTQKRTSNPKNIIKSKKSEPNLLIALHNNNPKGNFGIEDIDEFGNTQVACRHDSESKNLFWLASHAATPTAVLQQSQRLKDSLCAIGRVNVVTETAPIVADGDGSLSIYMANNFPTYQYVNIEIKAGKKGNAKDETRAKNEQLRYINTLLNTLKP